MATYSTNLALTLMATGEQSNTWGDTTNTNLGTLLEQAISGYVTQAITDGSSANTTITIPNGATGVARNMFIEMTGALTFSTTSLIVPANKKMYFIFNNTSGGFAVTVKVSGQTGILVPNGKKVVLTCNGTDIVEAHTAIVGNATMGGTLGVTGATTLSSTLGVTGVATLGNGAILGTPASGTVTNLTGTASININGTVGATTPAAGAFTTLSATGRITGSLDVWAGTFAGGVGLATTSALLDAGSGTGLVGTGTALDLRCYNGPIRMFTNNGSLGLTISNAATPAVSIPGTLAAGATTVTGTLSASGTTTLTSASANQLVLTGGTTVETRLKMIRGADDANQFLMAGWGGLVMERTGQAVSAVQPFTITMRGTTDVVPISVNYTGLAVTGTLSATGAVTAGKMVLTGGASTTLLSAVITDNDTDLKIGGSGSGTNKNIKIYSDGLGTLVGTFSSTGLAVTGTLSATGITTLATTLVVTAASNGLGVVINGRSSDNLGAMYFYANNGSTQYSTITASATEFRHSAVPAASVQTFYTNGSERMRIDASGIVTMSAYGAGAATFSAAGVISSVSDETWKVKDGAPVDTDAMLNKLEPGYWYYNDEKKETFGKDRQLGFYAQNVNAAIGPEAAPEPETVVTKNDDGTETSVTKPWGYYDRSVLAVTVMSLQKALATIESLTARITALEAK